MSSLHAALDVVVQEILVDMREHLTIESDEHNVGTVIAQFTCRYPIAARTAIYAAYRKGYNVYRTEPTITHRTLRTNIRMTLDENLAALFWQR